MALATTTYFFLIHLIFNKLSSWSLPWHGQSAPSVLSFFGDNRRRAGILLWRKGMRDEEVFLAISVGGVAKKVVPACHNCN